MHLQRLHYTQLVLCIYFFTDPVTFNILKEFSLSGRISFTQQNNSSVLVTLIKRERNEARAVDILEIWYNYLKNKQVPNIYIFTLYIMLHMQLQEKF